ncbi:sugar phosphate isomerase/epimerase family protein [Olivibacter sp. CPCC 100613]|uniref:sugar phosphate isomerase/epimerase family protein n=1 Tax=Olivibacter sp. CPCC 100613 TaxID=3079931 RepID=UPI002FF58BA1
MMYTTNFMASIFWCIALSSNMLMQTVKAQVIPKVGVCISVEQQYDARNAGFDFVVPGVSAYLNTHLTKNDKIYALPVYACNVFLPANIKCVGPEVDVEGLVAYADTVFRRAQERKVSMVVFGSGAARKIPDGYNREEAREQFVALCKKLAASAAAYNVKIALENLNSDETNFINTVEEALLIAEQVDMSNFGINADIYHMLKEGESAEQLFRVQRYILYCEIAEPANRTPPGVEGTDFTAYLRALKAINYKGGIGVEARWTDFKRQSVSARRNLQKQLTAVYR